MTNKELYENLTFLVGIATECRGKIGYAAARNTRKFREALTEYISERDKLILKLGKDGALSGTSPNFPVFLERMKEFDEIENSPEIFKITEKDLQNSDLTADIMLGLSFMTEEGEI